MIDTFKQKVPFENFLASGQNFKKQNNSYSVSYPEFVKYFSELKTITRHNLIIGINFAYGWMPTIFNFRSENFDEAVSILNDAKEGKNLTVDNLICLKGLFNNSLVGTSKLLHFINPEKFAIWDSRVCWYLTDKKPYEGTIGNCNIYIAYLEYCRQITSQEGFNSLKVDIENQIGYTMTSFRVAELIMYSNGLSLASKTNNRKQVVI